MKRLTVRKHSGFRRFLIVGRGRTGTTWMQEVLNGDNRILVYGEALNKGNISPPAVKDPIHYFEHVLFAKQPLRIRAVGAKLLYDQFFSNRTHPGFLLPYWALSTPFSQDYIQQRHDDIEARVLRFTSVDVFEKQLDQFRNYIHVSDTIKIIHIKRRNILAAHLSAYIATHYSWVGKPPPPAGRVELDYDECVSAFQVTRDYEKYFDDFFVHHDTLDLVYEDICANPRANFKRIYEFLEIQFEPDRIFPVKREKSLSQAISNYHGLKRRFEHTEWAEFFTESSGAQ